METFDYFYRKLSRATVAFLFAALGLFLTTLLFAVMGFAHVVSTLNGVTLAMTYVFGMLLVVFLLTSLVRALVSFLNYRSKSAS